MSHILCPECDKRDHVTGYGFGAGCFGAYTICECNAVLELSPDCEDLPDEEIAIVHKSAEAILRQAWGDNWVKYLTMPEYDLLGA